MEKANFKGVPQKTNIWGGGGLPEMGGEGLDNLQI